MDQSPRVAVAQSKPAPSEKARRFRDTMSTDEKRDIRDGGSPKCGIAERGVGQQTWLRRWGLGATCKRGAKSYPPGGSLKTPLPLDVKGEYLAP